MTNQKENHHLESISEHVTILNGEVGELKDSMSVMKTDIRWLKRLSWYMAGVVSIGIGKIILNPI